MSRQLAHFDLITARLFVAVGPPPEVVRVLAGLPRPEEPGVRWVPAGQWHVTLRFLGDADATAVAAALGDADLPGATARVGPRVGRFGRAAVVVPVDGLEHLAAAVATATAELGEPPGPRGFTGHLTLGRLRRRGACRLTGTAVRASFPVREVSLVSSALTAAGAEHRVLRRFPVGVGGGGAEVPRNA